MIEFKVHRSVTFPEIVIEADNARIFTGLLSPSEVDDMVVHLLETARNILSEFKDAQKIDAIESVIESVRNASP